MKENLIEKIENTNISLRDIDSVTNDSNTDPFKEVEDFFVEKTTYKTIRYVRE